MPAELQPRLVVQGDDDEPFLSGDFLIAGYQRGYRWGRVEVRQLLDDVKKNAVKERQQYLLQPIVVLPRDDGAWELIDGQQRLTTLYLIVKYIGTLLPFVQPAYTLSYETRQSSREYLESLGGPTAEARRTENIDFHHMFEAYAVISEWFSEQGNPSRSAADMNSALSEFVKVIWYQAPENTVAHELFARLNVARIPLTDAELVKALVLSHSAHKLTGSNRQEQVAAQWDAFERDLRDNDFWAFLNGRALEQSTHIDFLFESMTPPPRDRHTRPRYWTFGKVSELIEHSSPETFWRQVVERHGLLTGWFEDVDLYHYVGYLTATGDSVTELLENAERLTHSRVRHLLRERIRGRLRLSRDALSSLRYGRGREERTIAHALLLMNVETVRRQRGRFSFHEFAAAGADGPWSLEHIHAQNAQGLVTEAHWRAWLQHHLQEIRLTRWDEIRSGQAAALEARITDSLSQKSIHRDDVLAAEVINQFSASEDLENDEELHGIENLALLQRDLNSELNDAVFSLKRRRLLEHDFNGGFIPPCTRNVFLKYYSDADGQSLHIWGPRDRDAYIEAMYDLLSEYLLPNETEDSK